MWKPRFLAAPLLALLIVLFAGRATLAEAASCTAQPPLSYGNAPRPMTMSLDGLLGLFAFCAVERGTTLRWQDADGTARRACLLSPANFDPATPLPLLVWLHPSLFPQDSVILTGFLGRLSSTDLTAHPARRGFQMLLVEGRDTEHFYPFPDDKGLGWDNWYRNFDRRQPKAMNVDAATVDHFIAETRAAGGVDARRIYLSGWSNGAAFAQLYAMNTPGIAAAAVFSSPDPFGDSRDPCAQLPFASNPGTALMDIHNACDIIGICTSGTAFHARVARRYPGLAQRHVVIDFLQQEQASCVAACGYPNRLLTAGTLNHLRWPQRWNDEMFEFLRSHPLR